MVGGTVRDLYDGIAGWYDLRHHLQTLWTDSSYRREVVRAAGLDKLAEDEMVLDLGTGTGLTAFEVCKLNPNVRVVGIDLSGRMLGQVRFDEVFFVNGDVGRMPFEDNSFSAVVSAYGLGWADFDNAKLVMEEVVRVSKDGARVAFAEMVEPPYGVRKKLHKLVVEPWIDYYWGFKDLDIESLFEEGGIRVDYDEWYAPWFLGSTSVVGGVVGSV